MSPSAATVTDSPSGHWQIVVVSVRSVDVSAVDSVVVDLSDAGGGVDSSKRGELCELVLGRIE